MDECLKNVDVGDYVIKINHRGILDGLFEVCGVPEVSFRSICSAVDKLDKLPWEEVSFFFFFSIYFSIYFLFYFFIFLFFYFFYFFFGEFFLF